MVTARSVLLKSIFADARINRRCSVTTNVIAAGHPKRATRTEPASPRTRRARHDHPALPRSPPPSHSPLSCALRSSRSLLRPVLQRALWVLRSDDPSGSFCSLLQTVLQRARAGCLRVRVVTGSVRSAEH